MKSSGTQGKEGKVLASGAGIIVVRLDKLPEDVNGNVKGLADWAAISVEFLEGVASRSMQRCGQSSIKKQPFQFGKAVLLL